MRNEYTDTSRRIFRRFLAANRDILSVLALAAGVRVLVLILSNNEPGDADERALIAGAWASAPYLIRTGPWLPLHFYATGVLTYIFGNPITAGKVLSFLTGSLTVIPLFRLVDRLFDRRTALIAGLYFAFLGNHVGLSSVVMSEAPFALFAIWGLDVFFEEVYAGAPRLRGFLGAGLLMALAGGFRQEAWQLTGILGIYLLFKPQVRRYAIPFTAIGLSSYILWSLAQMSAGEDLLHALTAVGRAKANEALYFQFSTWHNLLMWAWIFVQSPGPAVSLLSFAAMYGAIRKGIRWDLALVAMLLLAPFAILSIVKPQWAPQARYALMFKILALPYAAAATIYIAQKSGYALRPTVVVILLATILSQGAAYHRRSHLFLPCADYDANDIAAWTWLSSNARPPSAIVVEDIGWRAPGLIVHAGLYAHENHIIYSFDQPEALERFAVPGPSPVLMVLHSPLSKWAFLDRLGATIVYENHDYRVLRIAAR